MDDRNEPTGQLPVVGPPTAELRLPDPAALAVASSKKGSPRLVPAAMPARLAVLGAAALAWVIFTLAAAVAWRTTMSGLIMGVTGWTLVILTVRTVRSTGRPGRVRRAARARERQVAVWQRRAR